MQHTATHAIGVRLHLWKTFFEIDRDCTPPGATNDEYGVDELVALARATDLPNLHDLADLVELMAQNYILKANHKEAEILMLDDAPAPSNGTQQARRIRVTLADIDAALAS